MEEPQDSAEEWVEEWVRAEYRYRLRCLWLLRSQRPDEPHPEISELEATFYPDLKQGGDGASILSQRDVDELQSLLGYVDGQESRRTSAFVTKAVLFQLGLTKVVMRLEDRHGRPHFHIEYRNQYRASYALDTLERLVGEMPRKYEDPILNWASQRPLSLRLTWDKLQAGKDVRQLILVVEEE